MQKDTNEAGEYALWDKGNLIGYAKMDMVDGRMVVAEHKQTILDMKAAAARDGVLLTLNSGYRPFSQQYSLRKAYRKAFEDSLLAAFKKDPKNAGKDFKIDSKAEDETFLLTADSNKFLPACAKPGWSNHQDGTAYDFRVRDDPNTKQNEELAFGWLVKNAIKFGFIRTVPSERWHWEMRSGTMYSVVPETHPSWKI